MPAAARPDYVAGFRLEWAHLSEAQYHRRSRYR